MPRPTFRQRSFDLDVPPRAKPKLYRDDIHGDIVLDDLAVALINTREFQRLDGIKQLGFAYLVYRTAKHTRFEHSIGCYHIARMLVDRIADNHARENDTNPFDSLPPAFGRTTLDKVVSLKRLLGAAALLHDVAHIPFGHMLEDEFTHYQKHDGFKSERFWNFLYYPASSIRRDIAVHERPWIGDIPNEDLLDLLYLILCYKDSHTSDGVRQSFEEIVVEQASDTDTMRSRCDRLIDKHREFSNAGLFEPFMSEIISDTICCDSLDYIVRDTHHTGLTHGFNSRVLQYFFLAGDRRARHLTLRVFQAYNKPLKKDILNAIFKLMHNRHELTSQVYYHRVKAVASAMLVRGLTASQLPEGNYYSTAPSITHYSDLQLTEALRKSGGIAAEMAELIYDRRLYKPLLIIPRLAAMRTKGGVEAFVDRLRNDDAERLRVEALVAARAGISKPEAHHILIYCPGAKMQAKSIDVRVQLDQQRAWPLSAYPDAPLVKSEIDLLKEKYYDLWQAYVFIHPDSFASQYVRNLAIEAFCELMGVDPRAGAIFPNSYVAPADIRLGYFQEWLEHRPNIPAADAMSMARTIDSPQKWTRFKSRASQREMFEPDFEGLFDALRLETFLIDFMRLEVRLESGRKRAAKRFLWEHAMHRKAKPGESERHLFFTQFAELLDQWNT